MVLIIDSSTGLSSHTYTPHTYAHRHTDTHTVSIYSPSSPQIHYGDQAGLKLQMFLLLLPGCCDLKSLKLALGPQGV